MYILKKKFGIWLKWTEFKYKTRGFVKRMNFNVSNFLLFFCSGCVETILKTMYFQEFR